MEENLIRDFLFKNRGYLNCGPERISGAIAKRHDVVIKDYEKIKKIRKEVKKSKRVSIIEDFRQEYLNLQKKLEGTAFAASPPKFQLTKKKPRLPMPSVSDQTGMHILLGCSHVPFHHKQFHASIRDLIYFHQDKIAGFHLIGDFADINTLSSHDKGRFTAVPGLTLDYEYSECNEELDLFDSVLPKDCWKTYLYGNHEDRWNRWMSDMNNAKTPLSSPEEGLDLVNRGYHVKDRWKKDYFVIGNNFETFHGIYFSIHCAKAHLDKLRVSCAFAHTHRVQTYREGALAAYNIGSGADFTSEAFNYATRPMKAQWSNGFAINTVDDRGFSHIEQIVPDQDGRFWYGGRLF
jgi:hypothetical protein